jgi:hypothetical protein
LGLRERTGRNSRCNLHSGWEKPGNLLAPRNASGSDSLNAPELELRDIQGDVLIGLQKQAELFLFFGIMHLTKFSVGRHRAT